MIPVLEKLPDHVREEVASSFEVLINVLKTDDKVATQSKLLGIWKRSGLPPKHANA